jgi:potassium/chloride transporter 4/5/6
MHRESAGADVFLLGLVTPDDGEEDVYADRRAELASGLKTCFFVHNGSLFLGDLVTPENVGLPPDEKGQQAEEEGRS